MREQFTNEVIAKLSGKIPDNELRTVRDVIMSTLANYEVSERETAIALYESFVPQFYEVYIATLKINGRSMDTIKTYNYHLVNFFLQLRRPLKDVTSADIYEHLFALQEKGTVSNRTLDHVRIIIYTFMQWCCDEGYIDKNPCRTVKPIKFTVKERNPLTDIELELTRDACKDIRESAIVETLYSTGCRVSELINLKKTDVDFATKTVTVLGKGNKYRTTFLNARAEIMLKRYLMSREDDDPALFATTRKPYRKLSKEALEKMIRTIGERANLDRRLTPHILRHTFATNLVKRGARLEDVQKLPGHEKPGTTLIYAKINTESIRHDHERYII